MNDAIQRMKELISILNQANYEYYTLDNPSLSDYEYDMYMKELLELESEFPNIKDPNSPTKRIGGEVLPYFTKVTHDKPMMSLSDVFSTDELLEFLKRVDKMVTNYSLISELKIDGLAINLVYKQGQLVLASTRGDGFVGEDVTENIKTIKTIPLTLKSRVNITVRGEIYLPISNFNELNQSKINNNETPFANPRNAASGTVRQLDSKVVASRKLSCFIYTLVNYVDFNIKTQQEALVFLSRLGFSVCSHRIVTNNIPDLLKAISYFENLRSTLDYDTDGVVIKVNEFDLYDEIGYTAKVPKWATAYKFPPHAVKTKISDIIFTVGRTGMITPVAVLETVNISGSNVSRSSLHNEDYIKKKDIRINDSVFIHKAAEIIPEIISVDLSLRPKDSLPFKMITNCPVCDYSLRKNNESVDVFCFNPSCKGKNLNSIIHYSSKKALDIDTLGEKIIEELHNIGILNNIADIYKLKNNIPAMLSLNGFGPKKIANILDAVENSKTQAMEKFIFGLGIPHVGEKYSKILCKHYISINQLINCDQNDLLKINDFGPEIAKSIYEYFHNLDMIEIINELLSLGVNPKNSNNSVNQNSIFYNKKIVITGTLNAFKRDELTNLLENLGAKVSQAVSSKTDYLICGNDAGSKLEKALEFGIKIILEPELKDILSNV